MRHGVGVERLTRNTLPTARGRQGERTVELWGMRNGGTRRGREAGVQPDGGHKPGREAGAQPDKGRETGTQDEGAT